MFYFNYYHLVEVNNHLIGANKYKSELIEELKNEILLELKKEILSAERKKDAYERLNKLSKFDSFSEDSPYNNELRKLLKEGKISIKEYDDLHVEGAWSKFWKEDSFTW